MSREAFEKVFPIPTTMIRWDDKCQAYVSVSGRMSMTADTYNDRLRVWQAATSAQEARVRKLEGAHDATVISGDNGDYLHLILSANCEYRHTFKISKGGAETLMHEIAGLLSVTAREG